MKVGKWFQTREHSLLSIRSRVFIGIHATSVLAVIIWIGYLFWLAELS